MRDDDVFVSRLVNIERTLISGGVFGSALLIEGLLNVSKNTFVCMFKGFLSLPSE